MELMFAEWEDGERFSFEDSDRFEEDSLCSFISEAESLCQNWRGWRKQSAGPNSPTVKIKGKEIRHLFRLCEGTQAQFLIDICCAVILCLSLEPTYATNLHLNTGRIIGVIFAPHRLLIEACKLSDGCKRIMSDSCGVFTAILSGLIYSEGLERSDHQ